MGGFWTRALAAGLCLVCFAGAVHAQDDDASDTSPAVDTAAADIGSPRSRRVATRSACRSNRLPGRSRSEDHHEFPERGYSRSGQIHQPNYLPKFRSRRKCARTRQRDLTNPGYRVASLFDFPFGPATQGPDYRSGRQVTKIVPARNVRESATLTHLAATRRLIMGTNTSRGW